MGGAAASATVQRPPAADLRATRGVERDLLSSHNQLLDFGAQPRLDVSGDSLQNLGLLLREGGVEATHNLLFDVARLFGSQFAVLARPSRLLYQRLVRLLDECVERALHLLDGAQLAQPLVAHPQVRKRRADQRYESRDEHWNQRKNRVIRKLLPIEHTFSSLDDEPRNEKRHQPHCADGDDALQDVICVSQSSHPTHRTLRPLIHPHRLHKSWPMWTVSGCLHMGQSGTMPITPQPPSATPTSHDVPSVQ